MGCVTYHRGLIGAFYVEKIKGICGGQTVDVVILSIVVLDKISQETPPIGFRWV